jgi:hypothetical protein
MAATEAPVFIVGVPRSGTTFLAAQLCSHSRFGCGPETHFFNSLSSGELTKAVFPGSWPGKAAQDLLSLAHGPYPVCGAFGFTRADLEDYLASRPPSVATVLSALTEQYATRNGKPRWVEKTPNHLLCLPAIRKHFPEARIIRIIRDPRDVALSLLRTTWGKKTIAAGLVFWRSWDVASHGFFEKDALSFTIYYEDLITSPEKTLRDICEFVGESFEAQMLECHDAIRHVNPRGDPWHRSLRATADASHAQLWRREMESAHKIEAESLLGDRLALHRYPCEHEFSRYFSVCPMDALADYRAFIRNAAQKDVRFWPANPGERPEWKIYLGDPDMISWLGVLGKTSWSRLCRTLRIGLGAWKEKLAGQRRLWLEDELTKNNGGLCKSLLKFFLGSSRDIDLETERLGLGMPLTTGGASETVIYLGPDPLSAPRALEGDLESHFDIGTTPAPTATRAKSAARNCLILGSGRSGTSMAAGTLASAAYFMGDCLHPGTESNPKGYFEDRLINELNEQILKQVLPKRPRLLGRWFFKDRPTEGQRWLGRVPVETQFHAPRPVVEQIVELTARRPYCFKDPRLCYTLPVWRPYLVNTVFICIFRDPGTTAASMLKVCEVSEYLHTLSLSYAHALQVWTLMYRHVLEKHRHQGDWLFLHYDQILNGEGLDRLESFLHAPVDRNFPESSLKRSVANRPVSAEATRLYAQLCELAQYQPRTAVATAGS